ncbi:DMT family transporter [candidate division WWE3 bacterium]|uniref:DMT family transporter n=1 Tax=candidate division WWE3 bacterium TaxID=2053526 RepID=A0A955LL27_UNCKA|nr:DMT family transporter [candidate division WWE3 bacterium]
MLSLIGGLLAVGSGIMYLVRNAVSKKLLSEKIRPNQLSALYYFFGVVVVGIILIATNSLPSILLILSSPIFLTLALLTAIIGTFALTLQFWNIEKNDISIIAPLFSVMPLVDVILAYFLIHETLTMSELLGVTIIVTGVFVLSIRTGRFTLKGIRTMLPIFLNIVLFSLISVFQKSIVLQAGPLATVWVIYLFSGIVGLPMLIRSKLDLKAVLLKRNEVSVYLVAAVLAFLTSLTAVTFLPLGVVTSLKNLTLPVSVIVGALVFGEGDLKMRFVGSGMIAAGAIAISLH